MKKKKITIERIEAVVQLFYSLFFTEGKHEGEETEEITNTYNFEEII
jgi:hypothetical protein